MLTSLALPQTSWPCTVEDVQRIARQHLASRTAALQPLPRLRTDTLLQSRLAPSADMPTGFGGPPCPRSSLDAAISKNLPRTPPFRHVQGHNTFGLPAVWQKEDGDWENLDRENSHEHIFCGVKDVMNQASLEGLEAPCREADIAEMRKDLKAAQAAMLVLRRRHAEEQHLLAAAFAAELDAELEARAEKHALEVATLKDENLRLNEVLAARNAGLNAACLLAASSPPHLSARSIMTSYSSPSLPSTAASSFDEYTYQDFSGSGSEWRGSDRFLLRPKQIALTISPRKRPRPPPLQLECC